MLGTDEMRAWYGPDHVALAVDRGAVGTLLISDELFRYVEFHWLPICEVTHNKTVQAILSFARST